MFDEISYKNCIRNNTIEIDKETNKMICPLCNKLFQKYGIKNHIKYHFGFSNGNTSHIGWNKGLTKETSEKVRKCSETYHKRLLNGEIKPPQLGKPHTEEEKIKISEGMKRAHKEGRAHNIGSSRWNNEPSYPEKFIMQVIENEIQDKNYKREFPFHKYAFDFAWPHKMKYVEIDGEQHQRFEEYHQRDILKDNLAKQEGWICLRMLWKDIFHNSKTYISKLKDFIDG